MRNSQNLRDNNLNDICFTKSQGSSFDRNFAPIIQKNQGTLGSIQDPLTCFLTLLKAAHNVIWFLGLKFFWISLLSKSKRRSA